MNRIEELIGQNIARRLLGRYLERNVPPLLIFHGPEGTGKCDAAEAFIRQKLCRVGTGCGHCISCQKIQAGEHPDYIRFPDEPIAIGEPHDPAPFTIRWLLHTRLCYAPYESSQRFILFTRADLIHHEATAALLKTLEEPPEHTRFILLTPDLDILKPTIVSRGVGVPFHHLPLTELKKMGEIREEFMEMLGGSLNLLPFFYSELYQELKEKVRAALKHPLALIELEEWLQKAAKNPLRQKLDDDGYSYEEMLDICSLMMLKFSESHEQRIPIALAIFDFKEGLQPDQPGLLPYLLGRLFHRLLEIMANPIS